LPGQGLTVHGKTPLKTASSVAKLKTIAQSGAFTLECWVSTETIAPPVETRGCMFCWGKNGKINLILGQNWYSLFFNICQNSPRGGGFGDSAENARPWLQHIIVNRNKKTTTLYVNGKQVQSVTNQAIPASTWAADTLLYLGNSPDGRSPYMGTYYLVAIHDQPLTVAEIRRHYQAGPGGR
jgi:hypothetical protein